MTRPEISRTVIALGLLGLVPFCAAPLAMWTDVYHARLYHELLANYALAIICFLPGIWWGMALLRRSSSVLIISNVVVVVAFLSRSVLSYPSFFLLCAVLFLLTVVLERHHQLFAPQPRYYARLRLCLSSTAAGMLAIAAVLAH
jgi:Protein of unknown function (DUF3429)